MSAAHRRVTRLAVILATLAICALFAAITLVVPMAVIARASTSGGGTTEPGGIWAGVSHYWGEWAGTRSDCTWSAFLVTPDSGGLPGGEPPPRVIAGVNYRLYVSMCPSGNRLVWVPQVPPTVINRWSSSMLTRWLPRPALRTAPPSSRAVVTVGTWFWTDATVWRPVSITAWIPTPAGPLWVTTTAIPIRLEFDPGDGAWGIGPVTCVGPGVPWLAAFGDGVPSPSGCSYAYPHSSAVAANGRSFTARLSVVWSVSWRASTGAGGPAGLLRTTRTAPVTVREIEGLGIT